MDSLQQFRDAMESAGLIPPDMIEADGKIHRFTSNGKPGKKPCWYVAHDDGNIPWGVFGDWRTSQEQAWRADIGRKFTPEEEAAYRANREALSRERKAEQKRTRAKAAEEAERTWRRAKSAPVNHLYLAKKKIKPHGARLSDKGDLIIPMRDSSAKLHSLQFIAHDGSKLFLRDGRTSGCYFAIGGHSASTVVCVAEGFATGATIHEATGHSVAVAFSAGNLEPVARALRARLPDTNLIVCADDDAATDGNPGMSKAKAAALAVGGKLAIPTFGADRPAGASDFNDLAAHCGSEAVTKAIAEAQATTDPSKRNSLPLLL